MNKSLETVFNELEVQRQKLLQKIETVSADLWNHPPRPGKWSISQILTHLVTSEQLSVNYVKKKSLAIDKLRNSGPMESLRLFLLIISQRVPLKYRAPKVVVQLTPAPLSKSELIDKWNAARSELKSLLEGISEQHVKRIIYKHPWAGRLNAGQCMIFMREHIIHHWPQIKRILNKN